MLTLLLTAAFAQDVTEEIIVWGDPFARWEQRWWVETEVQLAEPFVFKSDENTELHTQRVQARAVLDCGKGPVLGRHRIEAECTVERVALRVAMQRDARSDEAALAQVVAKLTDSVIQVQVADDGRVVNVDLEGLDPGNLRERESVEALRQLAARIILPFHLHLPDGVNDGANWEEHDSQLLTMPAMQGSYGPSRIVHYLNAFEDRWLVQSIGEAMIHVKVGPDLRTSTPDGAGGAAIMFLETAPDIFRTSMHGVAVVDPDTGIMTERVWTVHGNVTGSSYNGHTDMGYRHTGRLRMLDPDDDVDVGPSMRMAPPTREVRDLPPWVHLDP